MAMINNYTVDGSMVDDSCFCFHSSNLGSMEDWYFSFIVFGFGHASIQLTWKPGWVFPPSLICGKF